MRLFALVALLALAIPSYKVFVYGTHSTAKWEVRSITHLPILSFTTNGKVHYERAEAFLKAHPQVKEVPLARHK